MTEFPKPYAAVPASCRHEAAAIAANVRDFRIVLTAAYIDAFDNNASADRVRIVPVTA